MSKHSPSEQSSSAEPRMRNHGGKFWQLPGLYIEYLDADGGLRIWVHDEQVVLGAESATSLHDWMDRCRL